MQNKEVGSKMLKAELRSLDIEQDLVYQRAKEKAFITIVNCSFPELEMQMYAGLCLPRFRCRLLEYKRLCFFLLKLN
ncbi:uncharacterized protein NESG_00935 [Nematocida ausubeli]|uniref:Uncharacterized protein n=1 Tax=Nematocida ausubeli (strain ATCC PRA-371 / ERTm2) TaxID=1913371 RepID=A0A086J3R1_NEMA1|nr:uncharacterized protein NESG_00935 [Nematocida ausubeli]KFG26779.1 hypothetical protein NESG_00935 [Nematocida ausubeli]